MGPDDPRKEGTVARWSFHLTQSLDCQGAGVMVEIEPYFDLELHGPEAVLAGVPGRGGVYERTSSAGLPAEGGFGMKFLGRGQFAAAA